MTVSIPTYNDRGRVSKAVESITSQTYRHLRVIVVDDCGEYDPRPELRRFRDDSRVQYVRAKANGGYYAAHQSVLNACGSTYFVVQDADDWSEPDRIEALVDEALAGGHSAVYSGQWRHTAPDECSERRYDEMVARPLGPRWEAHGMHHGLFRVDSLRAVGGYSGAYRVGYDMLVVALIKMWGSVGYVDSPLYHRVKTEDSLTRSPKTGLGSRFRQDIERRLNTIYKAAYARWLARQNGLMSASEFSAQLIELSSRERTLQQSRAIEELSAAATS